MARPVTWKTEYGLIEIVIHPDHTSKKEIRCHHPGKVHRSDLLFNQTRDRYYWGQEIKIKKERRDRSGRKHL